MQILWGAAASGQDLDEPGSVVGPGLGEFHENERILGIKMARIRRARITADLDAYWVRSSSIQYLDPVMLMPYISPFSPIW